MTRIFFALLSLLIFSTPQAQTTKYVTDRLEITMRSGKSTSHKVIKMLPSGTALAVLDTDKESGYSHVKTNTGLEGWVITRYLLNEPVARERLAKAEATIEQLRAEQSSNQARLSNLSGSQQSLDKSNKALTTENKKLKQDLTRIRQTAGNALNLENENQSLKKKLFSIERDYQLLQQQTEALKDRSDRDWFIAGAGVLIVGMMMGFVFPKLRWRKKSSWGSL